MKNILITGGAGFIGSNLANYLSEKGFRIIVIDNLSHGKTKNLNKNCEFIKLDIRSKNIKEIIKEKKINAIFHLAAQSSLSLSQRKPEVDMKINLLGTINVAEAAISEKVRKLIFASSAAVYSHKLHSKINERSKIQPISIYGTSKYCSELYLKSNLSINNIEHLSLRFSNVYGEGQDSEGESGVIAIFIGKILKDQNITINGNGNQSRDFIYISDVVKACEDSLHKNLNGTYNISTGESTTINKLADNLIKISAKKIKVIYRPIQNIEVFKSVLSSNEFTRKTGWQPQTDLKSGLKKIYSYYSK